MPVLSTSDRYGAVAATIHWLSVILILAVLGVGSIAAGAVDPVEKIVLLRIHVMLGVTVLVMTLARIVWWWKVDKKPAPLPMPSWQDRISRGIHTLFYIVILGMSVSGIGMLILSGAGGVLFSGAASALPDFWDFAPRTPHGVGAKILFGLFVIHAGAAFYHQFYVRDGLLKRMWF